MDATIGRIVHYVLTAQDCDAINRRRVEAAEIRDRMQVGQWPAGAQAHVGNVVNPGEEYPMLVVRVWSARMVNGQVFLDGNDSLWVTSIPEGEGPRTYHWPELSPA